MSLKKLLSFSPLYIDSNGCNKAHRDAVLQSPEAKIAYNNCISLSPSILSKDSTIISNIFVSQEECRSSQNLRINANEDSCRPQNSMSPIKTKSTYNGSGVTHRTNYKESQETFMEIPVSVDVVSSRPATVHSNGVSSGGVTTALTKTSRTSNSSYSTASNVDATSPSSPTNVHSVPVLSKQGSLSDSSSSYRSSTDSLPGPEGSVGRRDTSGSPQRPPAIGSPQSAPNSPNRSGGSEPIYAESTKKKRRPPADGLQSHPGSPDQMKLPQCSEAESSGDGQRATITVMAAHTEDNNRTFYLSSPDSAVSTRCQFSPVPRKEPNSPAFRWPSPSHSAPSLLSEASLSPTLHPKPQSSPPIPPKRSSRSPKLGTSSLSPSMSSPVLLPEFPRLGTSSLSQSISSPVPLPELPMFFLVSTKDGHFKIPTENQHVPSERWNKPSHHSSGWNCRIEEEEEEEERERKGMEKKKPTGSPGTTSLVTSTVNGPVWKEARDWKAHSSPPSMTEPGTAPPAAPNNGACQGETKGTSAEEEGKHNGSMPAKQPLHGGSSELLAAGKGAANCDPNPPPPPPKKLHR